MGACRNMKKVSDGTVVEVGRRCRRRMKVVVCGMNKSKLLVYKKLFC